MSPGGADQHGHRHVERGNLAELFCDLSRLVDTRIAGLTDAEVDERLQRFLWSAGYARPGEGAAGMPPLPAGGTWPSPASCRYPASGW